jgi:hypothetical protein
MATSLCRILPACHRMALQGRLRMSLTTSTGYNHFTVGSILRHMFAGVCLSLRQTMNKLNIGLFVR